MDAGISPDDTQGLLDYFNQNDPTNNNMAPQETVTTGDLDGDQDTPDTGTDVPYQELCDILGQDKTDEDLAAFYGSVHDQMGISDNDTLSYIQSGNGESTPSSNDINVSNDSNWIDTHDDSLDGDDIKSDTPNILPPVKPFDNQ